MFASPNCPHPLGDITVLWVGVIAHLLRIETVTFLSPYGTHGFLSWEPGTDVIRPVPPCPEWLPSECRMNTVSGVYEEPTEVGWLFPQKMCCASLRISGRVDGFSKIRFFFFGKGPIVNWNGNSETALWVLENKFFVTRILCVASKSPGVLSGDLKLT